MIEEEQDELEHQAKLREIYRKTLQSLEEQYALLGPHTPTNILIQMADLRNKLADHQTETRKTNSRRPGRARRDLDFDFLMSALAAALKRLTLLEEFVRERQRTLHIWMALNSIGLGITMFLIIWFASR
jgi:hypothetical protein